ncbi:probable G-protein coupled receptor Mth-like 12 [Anoplolepis gracilipes]|uniref:probable G-protein coupled receptor Mth-like 12 n=1 Tax=Anoplolepis gracilipes TaxID=354296 RepID=UPI003B9E63E4
MCERNFTLWCCAFLLFVLSSESLQNSMHENKQNDNLMARYKLYANSIRNHDDEMKFIRNTEDNNSLPNEFRAHFLKYPKEDNEMSTEFQANFTKIENNSSNNANDNKNNIVPNEMCDNITCIQLCCSLGDRLVDNDCISGTDEYDFPKVYNNSNDLQSENKTVDEFFQLTVRDPCQGTEHLSFYSDYFMNEEDFIYLTNGSMYLFHLELDIFVEPPFYCLAVTNHSHFEPIVCLETMNKINETLINLLNAVDKISSFYIILCCCHIVSMLCLLTMFLIYSILPELRNIHSFILRRYSSMLLIAYIIFFIEYQNIVVSTSLENLICVATALVRYFCDLASSFWLSVMSFDMWCTFRHFRSLQRNVKQQERKKLMYSIFAWGGPFILTIICVIMDFVPSVSKDLIRPGFIDGCWFDNEVAYQLYYYGPESICIISSICLSIYTALKIVRYEKATAGHLRNSESRCYNDNKQWFNLYLKLFIMLFILMTINWIVSTGVEFWQTNETNYKLQRYIFYSTFLMTTIQNIGIFIIFVCKKTTMRPLLKRFCPNRGSLSITLKRSDCTMLEGTT